MKKYTVCWNEVWCCQSEVYAEDEREAINKALDGEAYQKEFGENEDVQIVECEEVESTNQEA